MQIAENWSRIHGIVKGWEPPKNPGESGTLTIAVDRVDDVPAPEGSRHRNLLNDASGKIMRVTVPASAATHVQPKNGSTADIRVRRGQSADQVFAHPEHIKLASE